MTTQTYQQASQRFLAQAKQELAAGDLPQASEKGWGATAQMIKAIAEQRGWEHGKHQHLSRAASRLRAENGRPRRLPLFLSGQRPARKLLRKRDVGRGHRRELGRCAGFAGQARDAAETGLTTSRARVRLGFCEPHPAVGSFPAQRHRTTKGSPRGSPWLQRKNFGPSTSVCHRLR